MDEDALKSTFSKNLKNFRNLSGKTQAEVAFQAGTSTRHYQRMEGAEMVPNVVLAYKVALALNTSLDLLFQESLPEYPIE